MMRRAWHVFLILLFVHLIAVIGFGAWLYTSGRVSRERVTAVYEMFKPTVTAQKAEAQRIAQELEKQQADMQTAARLESAKAGPLTQSERMTALRQADESTQLKLDRLDRAKADIQGQIDRAHAVIAEQSARLEAERAAFDAYIERRTAQLQDADFTQAVDLLAAQKPKQAKAMLQTMLAEGEQQRVVDYLSAMQTRIAAKILAEFKGPAEIEQATELVEALRLRGVYTMAAPNGGDGA